MKAGEMLWVLFPDFEIRWPSHLPSGPYLIVEVIDPPAWAAPRYPEHWAGAQKLYRILDTDGQIRLVADTWIDMYSPDADPEPFQFDQFPNAITCGPPKIRKKSPEKF